MTREQTKYSAESQTGPCDETIYYIVLSGCNRATTLSRKNHQHVNVSPEGVGKGTECPKPRSVKGSYLVLARMG